MRREQLSSETGLQVSRTQMRIIGGLFKQKKETKQQPERGRSQGLGVYCVAFGFTQSIKLCQILGEKQGEAKMMALKEGQWWLWTSFSFQMRGTCQGFMLSYFCIKDVLLLREEGLLELGFL